MGEIGARTGALAGVALARHRARRRTAGVTARIKELVARAWRRRWTWKPSTFSVVELEAVGITS
jgi:hypothetical protein